MIATPIKIDLSDEKLFQENELILSDTSTLIFGRNGTGKTTLGHVIEEKLHENYDVRVFKGFNDVVGENEKLNSVVLGNENVTLNNEIEKLKKELKPLTDERDSISKRTTKPADGADDKENLWKIYNDKERAYNKEEGEFTKFYQKSASTIKNIKDPSYTSNSSYDKNDFAREIIFAKNLDEDEIAKQKQTLLTETKRANEISFPTIDFNTILNDVNKILMFSLESTESINGIDNSNENFAKEGLTLYENKHINDICPFCGNSISTERIHLLKNYFSREALTTFEFKKTQLIKKISGYIDNIKLLKIKENDFYPIFENDIKSLSLNLEKHKSTCVEFLTKLKDKLSVKKSTVAESSIQIDCPYSFEEIKKNYNVLLGKNNNSNLERQKKEARDKLRFNEIQVLLNQWNFTKRQSKLKDLSEDKSTAEKILNIEKQKIEKGSDLSTEIETIEGKISNKQQQTLDESKLAELINKKLEFLVSFRLILAKEENTEESNQKGFYKVQSTIDNSERNITELSTGEKNIVAFLYFSEKLHEIQGESTKTKVIVFDDPMNSNDDLMQYIIMTKLSQIMNEKFTVIVMTHNIHFYLNLKYKLVKKTRLYHLNNAGKNTSIIQVQDDNDFTNSYEALWKDCKCNLFSTI